MEMNGVPALRARPCNDAPVRRDGEFVLYWMIAFRRTHWNFSLQRVNVGRKVQRRGGDRRSVG
jgi:hypothetical protein